MTGETRNSLPTENELNAPLGDRNLVIWRENTPSLAKRQETNGLPECLEELVIEDVAAGHLHMDTDKFQLERPQKSMAKDERILRTTLA